MGNRRSRRRKPYAGEVKGMDWNNASGHSCIDLAAYRLSRSNDMIHSELRALYGYWNRLRAGRKTPLRSDIDPRDMACDARNLFILENLGRGNIRFRLAGTAIVDAFGMELRGMNARAIMATGSRESFTALINETLEDPGVGYARLRNAADESGIWEINLLPLRSDFGAVDRVIGCLHPLVGTPGKNAGAPLRFRIEHMSVDPIEAAIPEVGTPAPFAGLAEPGKSFLPGPAEEADDQTPRLTSIDGGGVEGRGGRKPRRARGHLRLVKK
jgi:hypothetical protein